MMYIKTDNQSTVRLKCPPDPDPDDPEEYDPSEDPLTDEFAEFDDEGVARVQAPVGERLAAVHDGISIDSREGSDAENSIAIDDSAEESEKAEPSESDSDAAGNGEGE